MHVVSGRHKPKGLNHSLMLETSREFIRTVPEIKQILLAIAAAGVLQAGEQHRKQRYISYALLPNADLFLPWFLTG